MSTLGSGTLGSGTFSDPGSTGGTPPGATLGDGTLGSGTLADPGTTTSSSGTLGTGTLGSGTLGNPGTSTSGGLLFSSSAGTGSAIVPGTKKTLPPRTSVGYSTALGFIRRHFGSRVSAGTATATGAAFATVLGRLPYRVSAGASGDICRAPAETL